MSANATGRLNTYGRTFPAVDSAYGRSGNINLVARNNDYNMQKTAGKFNGYDLTIDVSHTHSHDHVHSITTGYNGNSSNKESRPDNFAIRIWKRTA